MKREPTPAVTDYLPVAIRAFAGRQAAHPPEIATNQPKRKASRASASPWTLIFDTETTTDAGQSLRFGTYQVRHNGELRFAGIFHALDGVTPDELLQIESYAAAHGLDVLTRDQFADEIFYKIGFQLRATIIGFNLPFDISRIAIGHESARNEMRGGFTFKLSSHKYWPNVRVKHLSRMAAFIRFAAQMKQIDNRSDRKRGRRNGFRAGHFVDIKTLAGALLSRSFSLSSLSEFLNVAHPKLDFDDFDVPISNEILDYAVRDVETTWECYAELLARYKRLGLNDAAPEKIYSEASIGKAYVKAMGIVPWQRAQPDFPRQMLGNIMGSYYGGRSEIRIRRELRQIILCDFLSMYPTVCTLMRLWSFVIADGMTWQDSSIETQTFLDRIDSAAMQSPVIWQQLTTLVRVLPDGDIFPVRAAYSDAAQSTIGLNYLTSEQGLWFTLADCIASKLLTGKAPNVIEAVTYASGSVQSGLLPVNVSGNPDYRVDPVKTDFFKRVIELRQATKGARDAATGAKRESLDTEQNALKIAANATSYGMYVETNVAELAKPVASTVHTSTSDPFNFLTDKVEATGPYYHPLLATLICGAARLMLAITERLVIDKGLEWSFCDTDSMAIAKPADMDAVEFTNRTNAIVDWFAALNPYEFGGSILKIEDVNAPLKTGAAQPLYCWAISAKRYALFNIDGEGKPVLRKASAHGLGHLIAPYSEANPATTIPKPLAPLSKIGVALWQHDVWWQIASAALAGHPDQVVREYHPALMAPATSRYAATTPALLRWFKTYNEGRDYRDQVKPFGFLLAMIADPFATTESTICDSSKRRPKATPIKPIAPFGRDIAKMAGAAFDRETGKAVTTESLKSYADALAQYHVQPESKFLNGDFLDHGTTTRRHVHMVATQHIGKEANDWERQAYLGLDTAAQPSYGVTSDSNAELAARVDALISQIGMAKLADGLKIPIARLRASFSGNSKLSKPKLPVGFYRGLTMIERFAAKKAGDIQAETYEMKNAVERDGLRETARRLKIDPSNLRRRLNAARKTE